MFRRLLKLDFSTYFQPVNIVGLVIIAIVLAFLVQIGIGEYSESLKVQQEFLIAENTKADMHRTYTMYGAYGIQLILAPNNMFAFSYNSGIMNLMAYVDTGARQNIFSNQKGFLYLDKLDPFKFIYILSFFGLAYGYSLKRFEYYRYLSTLMGISKTFVFLISTRIIISIFVVLLLAFLVIVQLIINGLIPSFVLLTAFCINFASILVFFFLLGLSVRTLLYKKDKLRSVAVIIIALFSFMLPYILNIKIDSYFHPFSLEMEKLSELVNFEVSA